jgi:UDP-N-acetylglucosamine transferase subunit ALG13
MILVTIGTNEQPFDRLVQAAAELRANEEIIVQYGASTVPHGMGRWVDFVPFDELAEIAAEARIVVCHAGVGSIMLAHRAAKRPVVMARRHHLDEAVDDHQLFLARRLHTAGVVNLVDTAEELAAAVSDAAGTAPDQVVELPGASSLAADLRGRFRAADVRVTARVKVAA